MKKSVFLKHEKLNLKNFDQGLAEDFLSNESVFYLLTLSELMDTWVTTYTRTRLKPSGCPSAKPGSPLEW